MALTLKPRPENPGRYEIQEIPGLTIELTPEGWQIWLVHQGPVRVQHHRKMNSPEPACGQERVLYPAGIYHSSEFFRTPCPDYRQLVAEIEEVLTENPRMRPERQRSR